MRRRLTRRLRAILGTTAFRLSAVYLAAFVVFALLLVLFVGQRSTDILLDQARTAIAQEVDELRVRYNFGGAQLLARHVERKSRQPGANLFLVTYPDGQFLAGNVAQIDEGVIDHLGWTDEPFYYERFEEDDEVATKYLATAQVNRLPNGIRVLVGRDLAEAQRLQRVLTQALQIAFLLMVLGALLSWLLVGRQALKRVDAFTESSERILSGEPDARLPVGSSGDEFDRLSARINRMLDRLQRMNAGLKEVSDSIAHDLKTPLTRLRNRAEAALQSGHGGEADPDQLRAIVAEADHLIGTFNALLTISRVEAGARTADLRAVDLAAIARDLHELYEPVAEEAGATLVLGATEPVTVHGSRELLAQALTNLVENAIKYGAKNEASDGATITLRVERRGGRGVLSVADNGPGIPPGDRERVTQRFVRLDESRTAPGTGLGLSLVKAIAGMHEGSLRFLDAAPGLRVEIDLPLEAPVAVPRRAAPMRPLPAPASRA